MTSTRTSASPRIPHRRTASSMSTKSLPSTRNTNHHDLQQSDHLDIDLSSPPYVTSKTASRIMTSVRRSFNNASPRKRSPQNSTSGVISTPEERTPFTPSQFRHQDPSSSRPTIEQIAMGLHVSRTPHIRPLSSEPYPYPQRNPDPGPHHSNPYEKTPRRATSPLVLPPPPARSSMKKQSTSNSTSSRSPAMVPGLLPASASSSTVTSTLPPTPQSSSRSISSIKFRMSRFLPGSRSSSLPSSLLPSPVSSPRESTSDFRTPKKAVRFSTHVVEAQDD